MIALIHDWLNQLGGAEDVLEALVALYPHAPLYTALYDRERMPAHWRDWDIRPAFIDRLPLARRRQQLYFPLYPFAFEQFDLRGYDVVLSNKSGFCHGVITGPETMHVCYCLTPTRYVWRYHQYAERESLGRATRLSLAPFLTFLRQWDRLAADRVDHFIAISDEVRRRIAKVYRREATIIYPPVDVGRFAPSNRVDDYYLFVGRLVPYRRLDLLIEAFNTMGRPLVIAGSGRDRERLEALAGPTVKFLGYVPDADLPDLLARCRAFMWPGEEDFGISPLQANAAGRPVIAYAAGGALETVITGPDAASATGALFAEQSVAAIIEVVESFDPLSVSPAAIRRHAEQYDIALFKRHIADFVERKYEAWNSANTGKSSAVAGHSSSFPR
ncbi:glycosyltransferase [Promineifilum sp.]|uniref:glycosyltransferase n=1 Tax=Promineifilum sp. TaxID=2664178 RepID=UPI0035AE2BFA